MSMIYTTSHEKKAAFIKFVYFGEELKPQGSLVVSINNQIIPTDKPLDSIYGRGIKTDKRTFDLIEEVIDKALYTSNDYRSLGRADAGYIITNAKERKFYLKERNFSAFFKDLSFYLKQKGADDALVEAFTYYYAGWRRPN